MLAGKLEVKLPDKHVLYTLPQKKRNFKERQLQKSCLSFMEECKSISL